MLRIFRHYIPLSTLALAATEAAVLFAAFYGQYHLSMEASDPDGERIARSVSIAWALLLLVVMFSLGIYNRTLFLKQRDMAIRIVLSFFIVLPIYLALAPSLYGLFPEVGGEQYRFPFVRGMVLGLLAIAGTRLLVLPMLQLETLKKRVLVLGVGDFAARIEELNEHAGQRFTLVDFVRVNAETPRIRRHYLERERLADAGHESIAALAARHFIDEIVVASRDRRGLPIDDLLDCKLKGVNITEYLTFWEREKGQIDLDALQPSWLFFSDGFRVNWFPNMLKRSFDVSVSLVFLLVTAPVIIAAAIAIRLEGPGPIFYLQERVGLNGRRFSLMKFRSMSVNAEKDGPRWAATNDQRITRVGAFIRKTRVDEIPQVINVLRGDMSFIGPRPERPFFVETLRQEIPYYAERHRVRPGISGWAQINYPYGASVEDARQKLTYDLYYVKNRSLLLDFAILLQTARVVLWPEGVR
jgi:sugar transferase (PEP-CTERM system associated)